MNRTFLESIIFVALTLGLLLNVGCTRSGKDSSKFRVSTPSSKTLALSSIPTNRKQCYAVSVFGEGIDSPSGTELCGGIKVGFVEAGEDIVVEVPQGKDRQVDLLLYLLPEGDNSPCPIWPLPDSSGLSSTYKVATASGVDILLPVVEMTMTVNFPGEANTLAASGNATGTVANCGDGGTGPGPVPGTEAVTVIPVFPTNNKWNDYVKFDQPLLKKYKQDDVACVGTETGTYSPCLHAAEFQMVDLPNEASCAGLTLFEQLGAFEWVCDNSVGHAQFFSNAIKLGKGLGDLLNSSGWILNKVQISHLGTLKYESASSSWWTNSIVPLPDSSAAVTTLSNPYDIYYIDSNILSSGYNINGDRISIVALNGASITYNGNTSDNCVFNAGEATPSPTKTAVICAGTQKFLWVEGTFVGDSLVEYPGYFYDVDFSRFKNSSFGNGDAFLGHGFYLIEGNHNKIHGMVTAYSDANGFYMYNSTFNQVTNLISLHNNTYSSSSGITLSTGSNHNHFLNIHSIGHYDGILMNSNIHSNVFVNVYVNNNTANGIKLDGVHSNVFTKVLAVNNGGATANDNGVELSAVGTNNNTITHITSGNNKSRGIYLGGVNDNAISQALLINNVYAMVMNSGSTGTLISQVATAGGDWGLYTHTTTGTHITNNWLSGTHPSGECYTFSGSGYNGSCAASGTSDHTFRDLGAISSDVLGKVGSDATNLGGATGASAFSSLTSFDHWLKFDVAERAWGVENASAFPVLGHRNACTTGTCRIFDWRLASSASSILNRSNDGLNANANFSPGNTCPAAVHGNYAISDKAKMLNYGGINAKENIGDGNGDDDGICEASEKCHNEFLVNATEAMDSVGDNDGLCESNEVCIYSPNFGFYQGAGGLTGACNFQDGTVSGVVMLSYGVNGH